MKNLSCSFKVTLACCLVMLQVMPFAEAVAASPTKASIDPSTNRYSLSVNQPQYLDSPPGKVNTTSSESTVDYPENPQPISSLQADQNAQSNASPSGSQQAQQDDNKMPVGTAAAPYQKTTGVAASRPAGAVIAPAKQHHARSIMIRVGVIAGAAVAIGTVALLSGASPSRSTR